MAGLCVGTIPPYYREVYNVVCPGTSTKVSKDVWMRCFQTSSLADTTLEQIWDTCDPTGSNSISRDGLYKTLALTALAQQGRPVEVKALQNIGEAELPCPTLASISDLRDICAKLFRNAVPTDMGYTFEELKSMDHINVALIPEKKGMVFKHVEYLIESKSLRSSVRRRYSDFETFQEVLVCKYPYRLIPRMPPKKMSASSEFIEQRRRALKRFLLLIVRHPILARDEVVRYFLMASGPEIGHQLKEKFRNTPDEFLFNEHAQKAEEFVSEKTRVKYDHIREQISKMHKIVSDMLQVAHNMEYRSSGLSHDMKLVSSGLSTMGTDAVLAESWTSGSDEAWAYMKRDCHKLASKFSSLSQKAREQGVRETTGFTDSVGLFLDLITAYQDLCERRERYVHRKHQKALAKVQTMVNYKERVESGGNHLPDKEDNRMLRRDDELILIEKRNFFSLFCLDLEAQLIHVNLAQLPEIFRQLVDDQIYGHTEYLGGWDELKPLVDIMGSAGRFSSHGSSSPPDAGRFGSHGSSSPPDTGRFSLSGATSPQKGGRKPDSGSETEHSQSPFT